MKGLWPCHLHRYDPLGHHGGNWRALFAVKEDMHFTAFYCDDGEIKRGMVRCAARGTDGGWETVI